MLASGALAVGASAMALTGAVASGHPAQKVHTATVTAAGKGFRTFHYNSVTVHRGDLLKIADQTSQQHTLSLVKAKTLPQTGSQFQKCFSSGICGAIAKWHKFANNRIHKNPVKAGASGWDKEGSSPAKKGDSVVFGPNKLPRVRPITAPKGTVLHFICAIHPNMQGTITVK
jgi:plastocyanin